MNTRKKSIKMREKNLVLKPSPISMGFVEESDETEEEKYDFVSTEIVENPISDDELLGIQKLGDEDESEGKIEPVSGWANSMAKILGSNKPKHKKSLILSRAKLDHEKKIHTPKEKKRKISGKNEIEIVSNNTDVETEKKPKLEVVVKELSAKQERKAELRLKKENNVWENINRIKPTRNDPREKEIELLKIATKGVVQLFNAVNSQQKTIKNRLKEVETSEFKKDKVLKKTKEIFDNAMEKSQKLSTDKNQSVSNDEDGDIEIKDEDDAMEVKPNFPHVNANDKKKEFRTSSSKNKPSWQALRDDYMLDAKMKDWDQSGDSDE